MLEQNQLLKTKELENGKSISPESIKIIMEQNNWGIANDKKNGFKRIDKKDGSIGCECNFFDIKDGKDVIVEVRKNIDGHLKYRRLYPRPLLSPKKGEWEPVEWGHLFPVQQESIQKMATLGGRNTDLPTLLKKSQTLKPNKKRDRPRWS